MYSVIILLRYSFLRIWYQGFCIYWLVQCFTVLFVPPPDGGTPDLIFFVTQGTLRYENVRRPEEVVSAGRN